MLTKSIYAAMTDCVNISQQTTFQEMDEFVKFCVENNLHSIAAPGCYHEYVMNLLKSYGKEKQIALLGSGGFPDGNWCTEAKLASFKKDVELGCFEYDLTANLSWIKSGMWDEIDNEINLTREVIGHDSVLKVICHVPVLTDEEIRTMANLLAHNGKVQYFKTATGREIPDGSTTIEMAQKVIDAVDGRLKIKISGGVRDVEKVRTLYEMGVDRFGCSYSSSKKIISALPD